MTPNPYVVDGFCTFAHATVDEAHACAQRGTHVPATEPRALCDRRHDGVNDDRIGYFVKSIDGGEFFAEECKDCRWVEQLRERQP